MLDMLWFTYHACWCPQPQQHSLISPPDPAPAQVNYKLRDWLFARQRYWGEPFPIVYPEGSDVSATRPRLLACLAECACSKGILRSWALVWERCAARARQLPWSLGPGHAQQTCAPLVVIGAEKPLLSTTCLAFQKLPTPCPKSPCPAGWSLQEPTPIAESELPLTLPDTDDFKPSGTPDPPLAKCTDWVQTTDAQGRPARRETSTMPQWAGSCWYYLRFIDPDNNDRWGLPQGREPCLPRLHPKCRRQPDSLLAVL